MFSIFIPGHWEQRYGWTARGQCWGSVVRTGVDGRAEFAGVSPGSTQRAAAGGAGHAHPDLSAAGDASVAAVQRVQEAVPHPRVWQRTETSRVTFTVMAMNVADWSGTAPYPRSPHPTGWARSPADSCTGSCRADSRTRRWCSSQGRNTR